MLDRTDNDRSAGKICIIVPLGDRQNPACFLLDWQPHRFDAEAILARFAMVSGLGRNYKLDLVNKGRQYTELRGQLETKQSIHLRKYSKPAVSSGRGSHDINAEWRSTGRG